LGNLTDALLIPPQSADLAMKIILAYYSSAATPACSGSCASAKKHPSHPWIKVRRRIKIFDYRDGGNVDVTRLG